MHHHPRLFFVALVALMLAACGSENARPPRSPAVVAPAPSMVEIWAAPGGVSTVGGAGIGAQTVFVNVATRDEEGNYEPRMVAIDRASRRTISRVIGAEMEIVRIDPLIVDRGDGQRARWFGTRLVRSRTSSSRSGKAIHERGAARYAAVPPDREQVRWGVCGVDRRRRVVFARTNPRV